MGKKLGKQPIMESFRSLAEAIETDPKNLPEGVIFRAVYPICNIDELNRNNRRYRKAVWEKVDGDPEIQEKLQTRSLFGHCEHPKDTSQSSTDKISHVVTKIYNEGSRQKCAVEGLDTPYGNIVKAILKAKCGLGMSTRAEGDLEECDENGKTFYDVVPESYNLKTVDFTADASTYDALPESVQLDIVDVVQKGIDNEKIDRGYAAVILESLKATKAKELRESIIKENEAKTEKNEKKVDEFDAGTGAGPAGIPAGVTSAGAAQDVAPAKELHPSEETDPSKKMKNALGVIVKDPKIRDYLAKNDPQALAQAEDALKVNEVGEYVPSAIPPVQQSTAASKDALKAEHEKSKSAQESKAVPARTSLEEIRNRRKLRNRQTNIREEIARQRIKEQNTGINFDEIFAEMQKASDDYYINDKEKKTLTESKTAVSFFKNVLKLLSEARRNKAILQAERDKTIEISEEKVKTLETEGKESQKKALEAFGNKVVAEVKVIYEKKMESMKVKYDTQLKEMQDKCASDIFQKTVIDVKIKESGLDFPENTVALLRQCKTSEEVDNLISKMRFNLKESLLHSNKPAEIPVSLGEAAPIDPLIAQTERMLRSLK